MFSFSSLFTQRPDCSRPIPESAEWFLRVETSLQEFSLRHSRRFLARQFSKETKIIHRRFSFFYIPYAHPSFASILATAPATTLIATRWLLKKHAIVSAEFRALEEASGRIKFDGVNPSALISLGLFLNEYVERHAFRISEETLAASLNTWQDERGEALALTEIESIAPFLRLLSLDKLSAVAGELACYENTRRLAEVFFAKYGPDIERFAQHFQKLARTHRQEFLFVFSATFYRLLRQRGHVPKPPSFFSLSKPSLPLESEALRESDAFGKRLETRVRILLRSLTLLGEFKWSIVLRKTNSLHKILIRDPSGVYARMTPTSQEHYQQQAASIARTIRLPEEAVARAALRLADRCETSPENHIGFYLIDDGLPVLIEHLTGRRHLPWRHWHHDRGKLALLQQAYFILVFSLPVVMAVLLATFHIHYKWLALLVFPLLFRVGKHLVDSAFVSLIPPTFLPRFNFSRGIPEEATAIFVIPALLKNRNTLQALLGKMETAYLSNPNSSLSFCILFDYTDAPEKTRPDDDSLLQETRSAIAALNDRYGEVDRFGFFIRERIWSSRQRRWMGWERKRGKLLDFARVLRNKTPSSEYFISFTSLPKARFVITLDEDAYIPRDFIKDILSIHAHPLQQPIRKDEKLLRGYTFIQPEVQQWFKNRRRFRLPRIFFNEKRFSAYDSSSPEVYQDIFHEGSFAGKGSFEIESYLAALDGTLPNDQILSHDLLEGSLSRTAYAADVSVFDEFPSTLQALLARNHRWTRGDWQIIDWLSSSIKDTAGIARHNTLHFVHQFKIFDNLLQSLARPSVFFVAVAAWWVGNEFLFGAIWILFLSELLFIDVAIDWMRWVVRFTTGKWKHIFFRFRETAIRSVRLTRQALFESLILPYVSLDTLHAIVTALFRRYFSRRNMLEWVPSSHFKTPAAERALIFPILFLGALLVALWWDRDVPLFPTILFAPWMLLPMALLYINRPYRAPVLFSEKDKKFLQLRAFETWLFFRDSVRPETQFLPPDYVRLGPSPATALYTSITNIGFFLSSILTAYQLGFISSQEALNRISHTLETLRNMERFRGHFYNWYTVHDATPAPPPFISSVDSGNLLAALLSTRSWLNRKRYIQPKEWLSGLSIIARFVSLHIPNSPETQSFSETWENIETRLFSFHREKVSAEDIIRMASAIEASMEGIALPKLLPQQCREVIQLFRERLRECTKDFLDESVSAESTEDTELRESMQCTLDSLIADMRFDFLRSPKRSLISIGYHVPSKRLETRLYQTLASEARLTNILSLAQGALSFKGWNKLNRKIIPLRSGSSLISWTGTLFEYLMPAVFLEEYPDSLTGKSIRSAIAENRRYAKRKKLPMWGLSESAYYEFDRAGNYRYKPFGLPVLSLSPLADDRPVVSAYAIALSLPYAPQDALEALHRFEQCGGLERYGYIESIDFFASRHGSPVRMFMSHHQGMILSTIGNVLNDMFLAKLFESHPLAQNSLFVLDEAIPPLDKEPFPRPAKAYLQTTLIHPRTP